MQYHRCSYRKIGKLSTTLLGWSGVRSRKVVTEQVGSCSFGVSHLTYRAAATVHRVFTLTLREAANRHDHELAANVLPK